MLTWVRKAREVNVSGIEPENGCQTTTLLTLFPPKGHGWSPFEENSLPRTTLLLLLFLLLPDYHFYPYSYRNNEN